MPDTWEKQNGLNASDASDRNKIGSGGFTMLEKYLNSLVHEKS
jgi:pectate lyase